MKDVMKRLYFRKRAMASGERRIGRRYEGKEQKRRRENDEAGRRGALGKEQNKGGERNKVESKEMSLGGKEGVRTYRKARRKGQRRLRQRVGGWGGTEIESKGKVGHRDLTRRIGGQQSYLPIQPSPGRPL